MKRRALLGLGPTSIGVGALVLARVWFEVLPTETVPEIGWAGTVLVLFAGSAGYHVFQSQQNQLGEMERPP